MLMLHGLGLVRNPGAGDATSGPAGPNKLQVYTQTQGQDVIVNPFTVPPQMTVFSPVKPQQCPAGYDWTVSVFGGSKCTPNKAQLLLQAIRQPTGAPVEMFPAHIPPPNGTTPPQQPLMVGETLPPAPPCPAGYERRAAGYGDGCIPVGFSCPDGTIYNPLDSGCYTKQITISTQDQQTAPPINTNTVATVTDGGQTPVPVAQGDNPAIPPTIVDLPPPAKLSPGKIALLAIGGIAAIGAAWFGLHHSSH